MVKSSITIISRAKSSIMKTFAEVHKEGSIPSSWHLFSWKVQKRKVLLGENLYPSTRETMARFFFFRVEIDDYEERWRDRPVARSIMYVLSRAKFFWRAIVYYTVTHYLEIFRANVINKLNLLKAKISILSRTYVSSSSSKFTHNYCS